MYKVKLFFEGWESLSEFESMINKFLSEKEVLTVQVAGTRPSIIIIVVYEE